MMATEDLEFIRRIDRPEKKTHAWEVRMTRMGEKISKSFSDRQYGGSDKAKEAAIAFRDSVLNEVNTPEYAAWLRQKRGEREIHKEKMRGLTLRDDWVAVWVDAAGTICERRFSIAKHGEKTAQKLAEAARTEAIAQGARTKADENAGVYRDTAWCARVSQEDGKVTEKQFSVQKFGEHRAKGMAEGVLLTSQRVS